MAPPPAKSLLLAKTLLTRTTAAALEQRKPHTTALISAPPIAFSPLRQYSYPQPQPHLHSRPGSHGTWPFPAPARVHTDPSAFGRHYTTFSAAHHHLHHHQLHQNHPVVAVPSLMRFALGAKEFVGGRLAPEIKRLGVGLSMGCGTPLCRHVRTIFSEKGGFDYW